MSGIEAADIQYDICVHKDSTRANLITDSESVEDLLSLHNHT
jgi:hypothetical protein